MKSPRKKYYRFLETMEQSNRVILNYMPIHDVHAFIETTFIINSGGHDSMAEKYREKYRGDVYRDYITLLCQNPGDPGKTDTFVARCLELCGFKEIYPVITDKTLYPWLVRDNKGKWVPLAEDAA